MKTYTHNHANRHAPGTFLAGLFSDCPAQLEGRDSWGEGPRQ